MKRWLSIPLAVCALVLATPSSQGGHRKQSCASDCGPQQTIVGWKTEVREVIVNESVLEKRKVQVTENRTEAEKRKVQVTEYRTEAEKRKVTVNRTERVKEVRQEKYWVCQPVVTEEVREYNVSVPVEEKRVGTRMVCRPRTVEEVRRVTCDRGHWETQTHEVACYSNSGRRGCCRKGCDSDCGPTFQTVCRRVWVPSLETVEQKVNVIRNEMVEEKYNYVAVSYRTEKRSEKVNVTRYQRAEQVRNVEFWTCRPVSVVEEVIVNVSKPVVVEKEIIVNVCKPVVVEREINVRVCRPVKKNVEVRVPVYGVVECAAPAYVSAPCYSECDSGCGRRRGCRK